MTYDLAQKIIIRMIVSRSNINLVLMDPWMVQQHFFFVEMACYAMLDEGSKLGRAGDLKMKRKRDFCGVFLQVN